MAQKTVQGHHRAWLESSASQRLFTLNAFLCQSLRATYCERGLCSGLLSDCRTTKHYGGALHDHALHIMCDSLVKTAV